MPWTIEHVEGAQTQSVEAWGLNSLRVARVSQGLDTLTFIDPTGAYDVPPIFAFDDTVKLKRDGVTVFAGRISATDAGGQNGVEGRTYKVAGPWSWLDQIVYQQTWKTTNGINDSLVEETRGRVVLGQDKHGVKHPTNIEMIAALNWAIAAGADIAIGTIDAGVTIPYQELVDVTCGELIRACLRWTPDAQAWWDYETTVPTLHIRRRADLDAVSIDLTAKLKKSLSIRSREDLQRPAVVIKYEKSHSYNGSQYTTVETDAKPLSATGAEPRALVQTIALVGSNSTVEIQKLKTDIIDETNKNFWKKHVSALEGHENSKLTISSATVQEDDGFGGLQVSDYTQYISEGAVNDWMEDVTARNVIVSAKVTYTGTNFPAFEDVPISVSLIGTDASKSTYKRLTSFDDEEPTPVGLAEALYNATSFLHYQGSLTLLETNVSGLASPANKLRLSGGLTQWTTMDALVQQTVENIDTGETTITFGPPEHLGPSDLVSQLRASRTARPSYRLKERSTAETGASGGVFNGPQKTAKSNGSMLGGGAGGEEYTMTVCENGAPVQKTFLVKP